MQHLAGIAQRPSLERFSKEAIVIPEVVTPGFEQRRSAKGPEQAIYDAPA
jgi:hypothetical protein